MGFTSPNELPCTATADRHDSKTLVAVCIPPGAQLVLENIPARLQQELNVSDTEFVTFTQLGIEAYTHRDAVRFENGREILLQRLNENQRARVLSLANALHRDIEEPLAAHAQRPTPVAASSSNGPGFFRRAWEAIIGTSQTSTASSSVVRASSDATHTPERQGQVVS